MPRGERVKSKTGYYHVIMRGINKNDLFLDEEDKQYFLDILVAKKQMREYALHAYCIMDNHVHLVIEEGTENIGIIMKRINVTYAMYLNRKYERIGPVFQDRFKSEEIEDEEYLLSVIRYIHQNPIKAGMAGRLQEYKWSSYLEYVGKDKKRAITDTKFVLGIFDEDPITAVKEFKNFNRQEITERFLDIDGKAEIKKYGIELWTQLKNKHISEEEKIDIMRKQTGLATRTLATIMGISRTKIIKVLS